MEKVVMIYDVNGLNQENVSKVNELLEEGWTVKSVTTESIGHYVTAIFVLTKEDDCFSPEEKQREDFAEVAKMIKKIVFEKLYTIPEAIEYANNIYLLADCIIDATIDEKPLDMDKIRTELDWSKKDKE